jgi:hypothetical protein
MSIVSRIDYMKDPILTLKKAILDARELGWRVKFVGDTNIIVNNKGNQFINKEVLNLISNNSDIVDHYQRLNRSEIKELVGKSKVMYHFAVSENPGRSPLEANSLGTPVVGLSNVMPWLDTPESGNYMVSASDKKTWINVNLANKVTTDYQKPSNFFKSRFDSEKTIDSWFDYYKSFDLGRPC